MNRGAEELKRALAERGDASRLAEELETDLSVVSRWLNGHRAPDPRFRALLQDRYGIDWRLWDEAIEGEKRHAG